MNLRTKKKVYNKIKISNWKIALISIIFFPFFFYHYNLKFYLTLASRILIVTRIIFFFSLFQVNR